MCPRERVQVERRARDERLALTRLHLGDVALVQDDAAHQLDVEEPLPRFPLARLTHGGERLVEHVVERLAVLDPLPELRGLGEQLGVGEPDEVGLERGDVRGLLRQALEAPALTDAEDLLEPSEARGGHGQRVPGSRRATPPPTFPYGLIMRPSRWRAHDARREEARPRPRDTRRARARRDCRGAAHAGQDRDECGARHGALRDRPLRRVRGRPDQVELRHGEALGHRNPRSVDVRRGHDRRLRREPERRLRDLLRRSGRTPGLLAHPHRREHHGLPAVDRHTDTPHAAPPGIRLVRYGRAAGDRARERHAGRRRVRGRRDGHPRRGQRRAELPHRSRQPGAAARRRVSGRGRRASPRRSPTGGS